MIVSDVIIATQSCRNLTSDDRMVEPCLLFVQPQNVTRRTDALRHKRDPHLPILLFLTAFRGDQPELAVLYSPGALGELPYTARCHVIRCPCDRHTPR